MGSPLKSFFHTGYRRRRRIELFFAMKNWILLLACVGLLNYNVDCFPHYGNLGISPSDALKNMPLKATSQLEVRNKRSLFSRSCTHEETGLFGSDLSSCPCCPIGAICHTSNPEWFRCPGWHPMGK